MPNANSITGILPFVSEICIWDFVNESFPQIPKQPTVRVWKEKPFFFLLLSRLFLSRCSRWSEVAPSHDPPFFLSQNWMNGRCWIIKAMLIFCHGFSCTQFLYLMSLSGRPRDTSRATPTIDTDTFCIYSHFLELFLSAALAINPHWPRVWCSINTTTHAQTRARVAGSIGSCVQTSFLFIINARKASKYEIRVCFDRVFALGLY